MVERNIFIICFYDSRLWLNPDVRTVIEQHNIPLFDCSKQSLQNIVDEQKVDRVYSCLLRKDVAYLKGCEVYATQHGLRAQETPFDKCFWDYNNPFMMKIKFAIKSLFQKSYRKYIDRKHFNVYVKPKPHLVVVSSHTQNALKAYYPNVDYREIKLFYPPDLSIPEVIATKAECKYFLCVSGNRWEKNNLRAIEAFDRVVSYDLIKGVKMKITGASERNFRYRIKNKDAFEFLGYVTEKELGSLYAGAYLFIYPSLNEGFGSPPMEAMRYGVPVIASPFSAIAEVCDSAAMYFNPYSVEEIMNRMLMMMESDIHEEFAKRSLAQYKKISERQHRDLELEIDYLTQDTEERE